MTAIIIVLFILTHVSTANYFVLSYSTHLAFTCGSTLAILKISTCSISRTMDIFHWPSKLIITDWFKNKFTMRELTFSPSLVIGVIVWIPKKTENKLHIRFRSTQNHSFQRTGYRQKNSNSQINMQLCISYNDPKVQDLNTIMNFHIINYRSTTQDGSFVDHY